MKFIKIRKVPLIDKRLIIVIYFRFVGNKNLANQTEDIGVGFVANLFEQDLLGLKVKVVEKIHYFDQILVVVFVRTFVEHLNDGLAEIILYS
jgi:hypothetical protein